MEKEPHNTHAPYSPRKKINPFCTPLCLRLVHNVWDMPYVERVKFLYNVHMEEGEGFVASMQWLPVSNNK